MYIFQNRNKRDKKNKDIQNIKKKEIAKKEKKTERNI